MYTSYFNHVKKYIKFYWFPPLARQQSELWIVASILDTAKFWYWASSQQMFSISLLWTQPWKEKYQRMINDECTQYQWNYHPIISILWEGEIMITMESMSVIKFFASHRLGIKAVLYSA